jgi:hypothetical protein
MTHPIPFPTSPQTGQQFLADNTVTYIWTGDRWSSSRALVNRYTTFTVEEGAFADFDYNPSINKLLDSGDSTTESYRFIDAGSSNVGLEQITVTSSYLAPSGYAPGDFGTVTYYIVHDGAQEAGLVFHGLTGGGDQTITGTYAQGSNTLVIPPLYQSLWSQIVSVRAYVVDSLGDTYFADVSDMWETPYGPCLVAGTLMTLADGTHKKIEDITYDDVLSVWNFDLGEMSEARPLWVKRKQTAGDYTLVKFSDGTELRTVGHHIFNKQVGEFTKIITDDTPVGTITVNEQGQEIAIVSKELVRETVDYYNIWTQYHLNAYANGLLTGNKYCNIYPVVDMKYVKDDRTLRSVEEFADIDEKYIAGMRLQEQTFDLAFIQTMVDRIELLDSKAAITA